MNDFNILVIIPARGGSKGIPRKNIRPLNGKPLIYYSIKNALALKATHVDCYVSSDDDEILSISKKFGAKIHKRNPKIADDRTTLDPVIFEAFQEIKHLESRDYDLVITLQPTSPLLRSKTIDKAIKLIDERQLDTVISGTWDSHLSWIKKGNTFFPNYEKRVNRQELPEIYKETGGFVITKTAFVTENSRFGKHIEIFPLGKREAIDIDDYEDWNLCEFHLKRKKIVFVVSGNSEIGMGHVYNTLGIANEILNHKVVFLVDSSSQLALDKIGESNHEVHLQKDGQPMLEAIFELNPNVIINDRLDTGANEIVALKERGCIVINFEDLGEGAEKADLVINAMYPENKLVPGHYFGSKYFILRDEFIYTPNISIREKVQNVLISFGGVDPNDYTLRILELIKSKCDALGIKITVITGMGYKNGHALKQRYKEIPIWTNVSSISEHMASADLVFTSAGRTTFEVASIGVPAVVLCQNPRETTHFFASKKNGFYNLGLGYELDDQRILETFDEVLGHQTRIAMNQRMMASSLKKGKERVMKLINALING